MINFNLFTSYGDTWALLLTLLLLLLVVFSYFRSRFLIHVNRLFIKRLNHSQASDNMSDLHLPNVSVVIPMKDELVNAKPCIQCLRAQNYQNEIEIVVVCFLIKMIRHIT